MTRISISNPRRERLKGYYRLKLRRAGRELGAALSFIVRPSDGAWLLADDIPSIDRAPMRYWEAKPVDWPKVFAPLPLIGDTPPERPRFDLSEIPGSASTHIHYWDVKWGDERDDPR